MTAHPWPELQTLRVITTNGDCSVHQWPPGIRHMTQLRCLELTEAPDVPEWLDELPMLDSLGLRAPRFMALPPVITRLQTLTRLDLSKSNMAPLPDDICQLSGLAELYLERACVTSLPLTLARLTSLTRLNMRYSHGLKVCAYNDTTTFRRHPKHSPLPHSTWRGTWLLHVDPS